MNLRYLTIHRVTIHQYEYVDAAAPGPFSPRRGRFGAREPAASSTRACPRCGGRGGPGSRREPGGDRRGGEGETPWKLVDAFISDQSRRANQPAFRALIRPCRPAARALHPCAAGCARQILPPAPILRRGSAAASPAGLGPLPAALRVILRLVSLLLSLLQVAFNLGLALPPRPFHLAHPGGPCVADGGCEDAQQCCILMHRYIGPQK